MSKKKDTPAQAGKTEGIHIGKIIRAQLEAVGMGKSEFGRRLNTSPQNVFGIFKRDSIDTNLLKRIGEVLNHNFFSYYQTNAAQPGAEAIARAEEAERKLAAMQGELEALRKLTALQEAIIKAAETVEAMIEAHNKD